MRIGFDAYFAFHYKTGVAHYSRNLINSIAAFFPEVELILFTDKRTELYQPSFPNISVIEADKEISFYNWLKSEALPAAIEKEKPDIFHGLDHGLPAGIEKLPLKKVVTVHDLFFETHPQLYSSAAVEYYKHITPIACKTSDIIISISYFTKNELVHRYEVDESKINVCYQTCNQLFFQTVTEERKAELKRQFDLPDNFFLYVGSVIERKNLLHICEAININKSQSSLPLIVIGEGDEYLQKVESYVEKNDLQERVRFISYTKAAKNSISFQQAKDVPAFHQMALALVYPGFLEGFGIPLIEAFASGLPVITSKTSSLPEVGGDAAYYVDPFDPNDIARALLEIENNESLRKQMITKGKHIVQNFTQQKCAEAVMQVYKPLLNPLQRSGF